MAIEHIKKNLMDIKRLISDVEIDIQVIEKDVRRQVPEPIDPEQYIRYSHD